MQHLDNLVLFLFLILPIICWPGYLFVFIVAVMFIVYNKENGKNKFLFALGWILAIYITTHFLIAIIVFINSYSFH